MIASAGPVRRMVIPSAVILSAIALFGLQGLRTSAAPVPRSSTAETGADAAREARVQKLRQALDQESQRAVYRWHDAEHVTPPTWFEKLLSKVEQAMKRAWNA